MGLVASSAVALEYCLHLSAGILEEFPVRIEYDQRNLAATKHAELHGLLHEAVLPLGEGHLKRDLKFKL